MNVIFLSPHFPSNFRNFCSALRNLNVNVLAIADEHYNNLSFELRESLTEYYQVSDMQDYDQLVRALGYFTHHYGKIDLIDSHNEYWLTTEARLRDDFNIPGVKTASIDIIKRKSAMKHIFRKARIACAKGALIPTLESACELAAEIGFPVVVKPDIGVGAANTYRIDNKEQLSQFFVENQPVDYIMEEFIEGAICTFDGLLDRNGNIVFYTSHQFGNGIMETVNDELHLAYHSLRKIPADLEKAGRNIIKALGLAGRFFHIEFFRLPKTGKLVALEINMRPPGGLTLDMFNYANNIDIYQEWANIVVNNQFTAPYDRPYHVCYVGRKNSKLYLHSHDTVLKTYGQLIIHHEQISGIFSAALGDYGYLIRTPDSLAMETARDFIHELR